MDDVEVAKLTRERDEMRALLDNTMPNDKVCIFQGLSDDVEVAKLTRQRDEMRALLDNTMPNDKVCIFQGLWMM